MSEWIKTSRCTPNEMDGPVWLRREGETIFVPFIHGAMNSTVLLGYSHWMRADVPPPPEESLKDKDQEEYLKCCKLAGGPLGGMTAWHAALLWERTEILKLMRKYGPGITIQTTVTEILNRCKTP